MKKAVIVGGGLIGMETCEALQLAGIETTVVEMLDQILPFLDWEMAKLVENYLKGKGIGFEFVSAVTEFSGQNGKITGAGLANGKHISCDLAVLSIGVRPNAELAKKAALLIGTKGGITVNRFLQTEDPDIYAAGDCIEVNNIVRCDKQHWPMGDAANLQGRVVADKTTGKFLGMQAVGLGDVSKRVSLQ